MKKKISKITRSSPLQTFSLSMYASDSRKWFVPNFHKRLTKTYLKLYNSSFAGNL